MKTCATCGLEYPDAQGFCEDCGSKLAAAAPLSHAAALPRTPAGADVEQRLAAMERKYGEFASRSRAAPDSAGARLAGQQAVLDQLGRQVEELSARFANIGRQPALAAAGWEERLAALEQRVKRAEDAGGEVEELRRAVEGLPSAAQVQAGMGKAGLGQLERRLEELEKAGAQPDVQELTASFEEKLRELDKWDSQLQLGLQQAATKADLNKIKAWIDQEAEYLRKLKEELRGMVAEEASAFIKREELARFRDEMDTEILAVKKQREQLPREVEKLVGRELEGAEKRVAEREDALRKHVRETLSAVEDEGKKAEEQREARAAALLAKAEQEVAATGKRLGEEHAERLQALEGMAQRMGAEHAERVAELGKFKEKVALAISLTTEQRGRIAAAEQRLEKALAEAHGKELTELRAEVAERSRAAEGLRQELAGMVGQRIAGAEQKVREEMEQKGAALEQRVESGLERLGKQAAGAAALEQKLKAEQAGFEQRVRAGMEAAVQKRLAEFRKTDAEAREQLKEGKRFEAEVRASIKEFEARLEAELGRWKQEMAEVGERIDNRLRYFEATRAEANEKLGLVRGVVERLEQRVDGQISLLEKKVDKAMRGVEAAELERIAPKVK